MFVIVGLMYCGWPGASSLAFALFLAAAVGDWLDGYLARSRGLVSTFGKLMDALTDKIMVMGLIIALLDRQQLEPGGIWLALVTLCREFLVTGMRMVAASRGVIVAADSGGKSKTVTQLVALGFFLAAPMLARDIPHFTGWDLGSFSIDVHRTGYAIFIVGTALAIWSGWRYVMRYRAVVFSEPGA